MLVPTAGRHVGKQALSNSVGQPEGRHQKPQVELSLWYSISFLIICPSESKHFLPTHISMYNYCLSLHSTGNQDECQEMGSLLNSYDKSIKWYISHKNRILDMEGQSNCVAECKKPHVSNTICIVWSSG